MKSSIHLVYGNRQTADNFEMDMHVHKNKLDTIHNKTVMKYWPWLNTVQKTRLNHGSINISQTINELKI